MTEANGQPAVGGNARSLGARPNVDIPIDEDGRVHPKTGGVSVAESDPMTLPAHRRPPSLGGTGKDPVWAIYEDALGDRLALNDDPEIPNHGWLEPATSMTFTNYQAALSETASSWRRI